MNRIRKYLPKLLLLGVSCVVAFGILEAGLRIFKPFEFRVRGDKIVLPANVEYTYENAPELRGVDKTVRHSKNSLGFRGADPPDVFADHLTVIAIGGSTTECLFLSDDKEWVYLLGQHLERDLHSVWTNNAGLDGQSTFGHEVLMRDYVLPVSPKVALFLIGANDVGTKAANFHDKKTQAVPDGETLTGAIISLANHSDVLTLALNLYRSHKAKSMGLGHEGMVELGSAGTEANVEIPPETVLALKNEHHAHYLEDYRERILGIVRTARENNIVPVLITQPALYGDGEDDLTGADLGTVRIGEVNGALKWEILELYNDVTREIGATEAVFVIDLARRLPKSSRLFYDWLHFSNEGAREVAAIIGEDLQPYLEVEFPKWRAPNSLK